MGQGERRRGRPWNQLRAPGSWWGRGNDSFRIVSAGHENEKTRGWGGGRGERKKREGEGEEREAMSLDYCWCVKRKISVKSARSAIAM